MTLGDHVRLYGYQSSDCTYVTYYARTVHWLPPLSLSHTSASVASEEEHLQQLMAVHERCAAVHSAFSSQDTRLHNFKLTLMLQ